VSKVVFRDLTKLYDKGVVAVDHVSFEVADKEFFVLVGPSGCGKSTTLRMVAGLEEISSGEIRIGDRVVNDVPPKDRDIAMVFQNYALYPHMSVYKNMAFGLKLRKYPKKEIDQRVREAARILGLDELLERKPKQLSGGQRQRVAVGRAIVRKPKVFLFDEPLSNLDAKMRVQMRTEIAKLHNQLQATMIYVTHDQVEAMTMGDRIVVMKDGLIQQVADPLTLYDHPANRFVAGFIGSPPMNFMEGTLVDERGTLYFQGGSIKVKVQEQHRERVRSHVGRKITFGLRPEDIYDPSLAGDGGGDTTVRAAVVVVEPMGSETYLYLSAEPHAFIAKVRGHDVFDVGDKLRLVFAMEKAHYFDHESEKALV
jgi:multiple sugar transport system ATP-binding protein